MNFPSGVLEKSRLEGNFKILMSSKVGLGVGLGWVF